MRNTSTFTMIFAIVFAIFFLAPAFLSAPFPPFPLMNFGDILDIFTPLVLMPLYWIFFLRLKPPAYTVRNTIAFILLGALWVEGQGIHLAANSIGHHLKEFEGTTAYRLTYFYDEILGHVLWHLGIVGLSALLIYSAWQPNSTEEPVQYPSIIPAALIYGFTYFALIIEGGTWVIGLPFALIAALAPFLWRRATLFRRPGLMFFTLGYLISLMFFMIWGLMWRGFPEFTDVFAWM